VRKLFLIVLIIFAIFIFINANTLFGSVESGGSESVKKALLEP